ncbi:MAG: LD-carboxypeptidase [Pseudomonadota bacterium]
MNHKKLVAPPPLADGGYWGAAAPAGPFAEDLFRLGLARLETRGFGIIYSDDIFLKDRYLAGPDETRARVLTEAWADPRVGAIIAARGGYGALRIVQRLDFGFFREHPKIFVGFSDLTVLLLALYDQAGLVSFHGPVVTTLAAADDETVGRLVDLVTGRPVFPLSLTDFQVLVPGRAEGPLLGGNLTMIIHLAAAGLLPDLEGAILFLEDVDESPYRVDRMLTALRLAGVLDRCAGLILGDFDGGGTEEEMRMVLEKNLSFFKGPAAAGFPFGHRSRNLALPVGPRVVFDSGAGFLDLMEPCLA